MQKQIKIPSNLNECFDLLEGMQSKEELKKFKDMKEKDICMLHHGFGTWIRNTFELWGTKGTKAESPLKRYFSKIGIWHADDMSGIIITSWHRKLNKKSMKVAEQIKHYKDYWKKMDKNDKQNKS
jgi:hypothetical protein